MLNNKINDIYIVRKIAYDKKNFSQKMAFLI